MTYYYVYILYSPMSKDFYSSFSVDLKSEIKDHNTGKISITRDNKPWKLVWYSAFSSKEKAQDYSEYLESDEGKAYIDKWFVSVESIVPVGTPTLERPLNAKTCPICGGAGKAANDTFSKYGQRFSKNVTTCMTCVGRGWIDPDKKITSADY